MGTATNFKFLIFSASPFWAVIFPVHCKLQTKCRVLCDVGVFFYNYKGGLFFLE